ncbi:MAG: MGH1-like glycoside hydrolase domain-containing protein [Phycisphaerales bacterium]
MGDTPDIPHDDPEHKRLEEDQIDRRWRRWGPWLSDRQWGTVREDYSADGNAWKYLTHDMARSRAYRWGEDGLAGFCDDKQRLCLGLALWNGKDPILKERLFGLDNAEGNHGEDVKELYWHQDAVPSGAYLRFLYKYPQRAFPYDELVRVNAQRSRQESEYELLDTEAMSDDRHFDVTVEWAKADPADILWRVTVRNNGPEAAPITLLLQSWFRNTWSWEVDAPRPTLRMISRNAMRASHAQLGEFDIACEGFDKTLFCDNDTNQQRCFGTPNPKGLHPKDTFHEAVVHGRFASLPPLEEGTKAAFMKAFTVPAGGTVTMRARMRPAGTTSDPFSGFDELITTRVREADAFYALARRPEATDEQALVQRRALAGLLWNYQWYQYDVHRWLTGDPTQPAPPPERLEGRNSRWHHMDAEAILSMPDKWEYPWFAHWDLAFQAVATAAVDIDRAKRQIWQIVQPWMQHPEGQVPAYEWALNDVNPPTLAWAAYRIFQIERLRFGREDHDFLAEIVHKLLLDFTWWVNRKDADGRNIFEGGFLGLDNIGIFDRSRPLPTGGVIKQSDGTAWVAKYCLDLMRMCLELADAGRPYASLVEKCFEHFLQIAKATTNLGGRGIDLWDEEDQFFYDQLVLPDGRTVPLKVKSFVGLVPLFACTVIDEHDLKCQPQLDRRLQWFLDRRPDMAKLISRWNVEGVGQRRLLSLLRGHRMKALLQRALDPKQFLSPHGIRSVSLEHRDNPYRLTLGDQTWELKYTPGESDTGSFGGNSNWRGPVWFPMNFLLIEALCRFHGYYGDDFTVECPTGSGQYMNLLQVAEFLSDRLSGVLLPGPDGVRPANRHAPRLDKDPLFAGNPLFYEYFHGDDGHGLGASHQTGWTALAAILLGRARTRSVMRHLK